MGKDHRGNKQNQSNPQPSESTLKPFSDLAQVPFSQHWQKAKGSPAKGRPDGLPFDDPQDPSDLIGVPFWQRADGVRLEGRAEGVEGLQAVLQDGGSDLEQQLQKAEAKMRVQ